MTDYRLKVLHFSDLHERGPREKEPWRRRRVLGDAWKRNLDDIMREGAVDMVCFTGDVTDFGLAAEYGPVGDFVGALLTQLSVPMDRLFIVPGNHDIQRKKAESEWKLLRPLLLSVPALERSRWMAGGKAPRGVDASHRDLILERSRAYRAWLESMDLTELLPELSPHGRLGYRRSIRSLEIRDLPFEVHVIGLDSAWMCGDDGDSGKLLLTEDQVARLATDRGESLGGFRLALVHHPLSDLADGDSCRDLLAQHVDLLLRGHLHREDLAEWVSPDQRLRQIAAGCLYEGEHANHWPNACHVIDITLDAAGRPKRYDVRLRGFSDRGAGFWFDDNGLYRESRDGRLRWQITAPPLPPPRRPTDVFVGREAELAALERALLPVEGPRQPVAIVAVFGMAGVGKSYLAEHFAAMHAARFPGGVLRLVLQPDETRAAEALFGELADRLGVPPAAVNARERVRERLRSPPALVHIENADARAAASAAAMLADWLEGCAVIVTGRFHDLGRDAGWVQVPVATFDETIALKQIEKEHRAPRDAVERRSFCALARELGYLPLALSLAAGYLRRFHSPEGFVALLVKKGLRLEPASPTSPALRADRTRAIVATTFELSLELLRRELDSDADRLLAAFAALGHGPAGGFGRSLGEAIANAGRDDFERLVATAGDLSLLQRVAGEEDRWSLHPLLAELLRRREGGEEALDRMTAWFVVRLPERPAGEEVLQGQRWREIECERSALVGWLPRVADEDIARVAGEGSQYARRNGPFQAWVDFCERGIAACSDAGEQSNLLWILADVAQSSGAMDRALKTAEAKGTLDRDRGDARGAALAAGIRADVLQARGQLDEALRIRRNEELPVYEQLGDVRLLAGTMGQIADVLENRGQLDEALRIHREEQLPVYEQLGDVHARAVTMGKIADVLQARGQLDEALRIRREEQLPVFEQLGDVRLRAVTMGRIADVLQARGQLDEALRIRRDDELPVYEQLGDVRSRAVTMGKIADVLQARGQLDEALRIRRDDELPVFEQLGDVRSRAVTMGKIADVLQARGQLDEALRIHREEQLPIYEQLGDVRERAVTMGKIADVLQARGQLDEALRIRREEQLPVYEQLGDVRSRAVTMGKIADVLQARGQLNEALRICREEQLPVYEQLGDVRSRALTMGKIADVLQARGQLDEALRIRREEQLPVFEQLGDVRSRAVTMGKIADVLQARGQLDEALRIRRDEELPVYEQLGAQRDALVTRAELALTHLARSQPGDRETARELLRLAWEAAERMRLPEAAQIRAIQVKHNLLPDPIAKP